MGGPMRFRGVTWVAVPRMLVGRLVVGLVMVTGALVAVVASVVQSFTNQPQSWYFYPLAVLGLAIWLALVALNFGAGVYVRERGVVVVNPLWVSSLRWDEIDRFSLDESPISARSSIGRVYRRGGGSTTLWGIRPYGDTYSRRRAQEAIDFLNQAVASQAESARNARTLTPRPEKNGMSVRRLRWAPRKVFKVALAVTTVGIVGSAAAGWSGLFVFQLTLGGFAWVAGVVAIWAANARDDSR